MFKYVLKILVVLFIQFFFIVPIGWAKDEILVFAGAASKPALEEIAKKFEEDTNIKVDLIFGGSGFVLSQMMLSKKGDVYFPGSSDFMEKAKSLGVVFPQTEKKVVYLVPAIVVQRGNPKKIVSLKDLTREGVKIVIANPHDVCVGLYA
ncbi:MAG: extracellular solute-binding protein, partial [Thermodesulfovibrionales bacterium]|nr:extracellular solute-binding protein [Thermodesulfovibrionales bacterium]